MAKLRWADDYRFIYRYVWILATQFDLPILAEWTIGRRDTISRLLAGFTHSLYLFFGKSLSVLFLQVLLELVKGMVGLSNTEPTAPLGPMELELMLKPITTVRKQLDIAFLEGADVGPKVSKCMFSGGVVSPVIEKLNQLPAMERAV